MISVLLVDEHILERSSLRRLLEDGHGILVLDEADDSEQAMQRVRDGRRPDVALISINAPGISILNGTRRFMRLFPDVKVILITTDLATYLPIRLLQCGAQGLLTKHCTAEELIAAVKSVSAGRPYISKRIAKQVALDHASGDPASPFEELSQRELQVLLLLSQGENTGEISHELCISPKTVNTYRHRLMGKFGVHTEVELMHIALRHGIIRVSNF